MPTFSVKTTGTGPFYVDLVISPGVQNIAQNTTNVSWSLRARSTGGSPTWSASAQSWSVNIGGFTNSGTWTLDFRNGVVQIIVASSTWVIEHNNDGTKTLTSSGTLITDHTSFGRGTASGSVVLDRIPRGPKVRYNGAWRDTIAYVRSGGTWRNAVPYVKVGASWKPAG